MGSFNRAAFEQVLKEHPSLQHYTNINAAASILESNTLWATDFRNMNDSSEFFHLKPRLSDAIQPTIDRHLRNIRKNSRAIELAIARAGGPRSLSRTLADGLVAAPYDALMGTGFMNDQSWRIFMACFCSGTGLNSYDRANGLLNQWRVYAGNGGVCLQFSTAFLLDMVEAENVNCDLGCGIYKVQYDDLSDLASLYPALVQSMSAVACSSIENDWKTYYKALDEFLYHLIFTAGSFKNGGFWEEREVRIMAIVQEDRNSQKPMSRIIDGEPGKFRPHIALNKPGLRLSDGIERILIGPGSEQDRSARRIRELAPAGTEVACSDIPFVF